MRTSTNDRKWLRKANPSYAAQMEKHRVKDLQVVINRRMGAALLAEMIEAKVERAKKREKKRLE